MIAADCLLPLLSQLQKRLDRLLLLPAVREQPPLGLHVWVARGILFVCQKIGVMAAKLHVQVKPTQSLTFIYYY